MGVRRHGRVGRNGAEEGPGHARGGTSDIVPAEKRGASDANPRGEGGGTSTRHETSRPGSSGGGHVEAKGGVEVAVMGGGTFNSLFNW